MRYARESDAKILTSWWNDGAVMAHAGFPRGIGTSEAEVAAKIKLETPKRRRLILENADQPIGEANYRITDDATAWIGINICDHAQLEHGYGTRFLVLLIGYLFRDVNVSLIKLDTKRENARALHVYRCKIGMRETACTDLVVEFELTEDEFLSRFPVDPGENPDAT